MAKVDVNVSKELMLRLVKEELKAGSYNVDQLIRLSNAAANEVYKRDAESIQPIFRNSKRLFMKYWNQFKSPLALRRKREAAILALQKLNQEVVT